MRLLCNYWGLCPIKHFLEAINLLLALLNAGNRLDVNDSVGDVVVPIIVHGIFEQVWVRLLVISKLFVNTDRGERPRYHSRINWDGRGIFVRYDICGDRVLWVDPLRWSVSLKDNMMRWLLWVESNSRMALRWWQTGYLVAGNVSYQWDFCPKQTYPLTSQVYVLTPRLTYS